MNKVHYEYTDYTTDQAMNIMLTAERDVCECTKKHNNNDAVNIAEVAFKIGVIMSRARSDIYALLKAEENKSHEAKEVREEECLPKMVLDEIRTEIEQEYNGLSAIRADNTLGLGEYLGLKKSLMIIDKHRKERANENCD